jgi:hypothetical protein
LVGQQGAFTLLIAGPGCAVLRVAASLCLPHIPPGQELEEVET